MRVKLEWLRELVDLSNISNEEIINKLSLNTIEVESVSYVLSGTNLVVGRVLTKDAHSDSDHLSLTTVDVGAEVLQIVCGAPNVEVGQLVIVAKVGAVLPGDLKIKRSKIRGVESFGMICSLEELGMEKKFVPSEYLDGIFYFKEEHPLGTSALIALNLDDEVIELGLTPNRNDLLSMVGVAIDASSVFNRPLKKTSFNLLRTKDDSSDYIEVINETKDCSLYYAQVVKNIKIEASPWWLISRLISFGIRPINNVVDVTNYILALFGQPLHAFDYDKLGKKILVRNAVENEEITTLDGEKRNLKTSDVVITDGVKPVVIAGVMGGVETEITSETRNVVIEAAVFNPDSVKNTSNRLDLVSESSLRYEKGVPVAQTKIALDYASYLLSKLANGEVIGDAVKIGKVELNERVIIIKTSDILRLTGLEISSKVVIQILNNLKLDAKIIKDDTIEVKITDRRRDITIPEDLIEEVVRIYGYDKLEARLPKTNSVGSLTEVQERRRKIKNIFRGLSFNEVITYSLQNEEANNSFLYNHQNKDSIELLMPLSNERRYLRKTLLASLVENASYLSSRKMDDLAIFELAKVYYQGKETNLPMEKNPLSEDYHLGLLMSGNYSTLAWDNRYDKVDFYLIKGILENLFSSLNITSEISFRPLGREVLEFHPHVSAEVYYKNNLIGVMGQIHPKYQKQKDLNEVFVAEIDLSGILGIKDVVTKFEPFSKLPSIKRDIAVVIDKEVLAADILDEIRQADKKNLTSLEIFDIYTGDKIDSNKKSVAINLEFTSNEVLTDDVINSKVNRILKQLNNKFNATLRQ